MMWSGSSKKTLCVLALLCGAAMPAVRAAETQSTPLTTKTQLVLKLATDQTLPVRSRMQADPPAIIVEFPPGRVTGTLPERSMIQRGVVEEIQTLYASSTKPGQPRWIQGLKVVLRGPYDCQVRAEQGRVVIDIAHPASIGREELELGLGGGAAVIAGAMPSALSERFRAMQDALNRARPQPWIWQASAAPASSPSLEPAATLFGQPLPRALPAKASSAINSAIRQANAKAAAARPGADPLTVWTWVLGGIGLAGLIGTLWLWARHVRRLAMPSPGRPAAPPLSSGIRLIDQLAWRAFEQQGYQLLHVVELGESLGVMRIAAKDAAKAALLCVGNGAFFEKSTVEQFIQSMRNAHVDQGFLIAPGSFTVPAQRCAKENGVTLIGREQLTQLLSDGAVSEHYVKQIQQLHKQLEDAQEQANEAGRQLEAMRLQRNEASWLLGEARANVSQLESQGQELTHQLDEVRAQVAQWQQGAERLKRQWEESQWYLGEARAAAHHLDEQLRSLHHDYQQLQEQARSVSAQVNAAEQARTADDRRRAPRRFYSDITVEILRPDGSRMFEGVPRDISRTGLGFQTEQSLLDIPDRVQVRLYLPESPQPVDATARLVWQRQPSESSNGHHHQTGCEFLDMPVEGRSLFETILAKP